MTDPNPNPAPVAPPVDPVPDPGPQPIQPSQPVQPNAPDVPSNPSNGPVVDPQGSQTDPGPNLPSVDPNVTGRTTAPPQVDTVKTYVQVSVLLAGQTVWQTYGDQTNEAESSVDDNGVLHIDIGTDTTLGFANLAWVGYMRKVVSVTTPAGTQSKTSEAP